MRRQAQNKDYLPVSYSKKENQVSNLAKHPYSISSSTNDTLPLNETQPRVSLIKQCVRAQSPVLSDSLRFYGCSLPGSSVHGIIHGVHCYALLQGIFQTQGSKWTQAPRIAGKILYRLSHNR